MDYLENDQGMQSHRSGLRILVEWRVEFVIAKVKARNGAILVYVSPIVTEGSNLKDFLVFLKGLK